MVVLDLGSGAGNDAFVARRLVGESGKVIGVDMTPVMIDKARAHAETLGYNNVEFRLGDIEKLPIAANTIDVVLSNCVLNLVPDKTKAFSEIFRVLKPGGSFCISDVVLIGILPTAIQESAEMYVGCVSSAIQQDEYLAIIKNAGFADVQVLSAKPINIPEDILSAYLGADAAQQYLQSESPIKSITVKGIKKSSCAPGSACCS
jgi:SAM-dependent methyltransferase